MFRFGDPGGAMYNLPTAASGSIAPLLYAWTNYSNHMGAGGDDQMYVTANAGRVSGTPALHFHSTNGNRWSNLLKTLPDSQATLGIAFAFNTSKFPQASWPNPPLVQFVDGSTTQLYLWLSTTGTLGVGKSVGTQLGVQGGAISYGQWVHIEFLATFGTSGSILLYVNGVQVYSYSGNTINTANSYAQGIILGLGTSSTNCGIDPSGDVYFDDIIIYDGQTTDANGFSDIHSQVGNRSLSWLLPTGAGNATAWTPLSGSNWSEAADVTVDGDTSYVSAATSGLADTYAMASLPGIVSSVQVGNGSPMR